MMSKAENAAAFMTEIANDASHGYDQIYRWGEKGDYDCSSLVITSWQNAGVPVKADGASYTGNMYDVFLNRGFSDVTGTCNLASGSGMKRGDVLLNHVHHTAMYLGNGQIAQASINEKGTVSGGQPGDQRQLRGQKGEINICGYYNYPWNCVLRYTENSKDADSGGHLSTEECLSVDGSFGPATVRRTQQFLGTVTDGLISNQPMQNKRYLYAADENCWEFKTNGYRDGSEAVRAMQQLFGAKADGWLGKKSVIAMQRFLNVMQDGSMGTETVKEWQKYLNNQNIEK